MKITSGGKDKRGNSIHNLMLQRYYLVSVERIKGETQFTTISRLHRHRSSVERIKGETQFTTLAIAEDDPCQVERIKGETQFTTV